MAFPASTQIQSDGLDRVRTTALTLKKNMQRNRDTMAAGNVQASLILTVLSNVRDSISVFDDVASIPGIGSYAQAQYDDTALDVSTEFSNMRSAAVAVRDWITTNIPSDANGYLLLQSFDASGQTVWREFTPTQTAGLRTAIDSLIATVG